MWEKIRNQPVIIGSVIGAALIAGLQSLAGHGVIGQDVVDTAAKAVGESGWVWPIVLGFLASRFSWGPVTHDAAVKAAATTAAKAGPEEPQG